MPRIQCHESGFQALADSVSVKLPINSYESQILMGSAFQTSVKTYEHITKHWTHVEAHVPLLVYIRCSKHCIYQCFTMRQEYGKVILTAEMARFLNMLQIHAIANDKAKALPIKEPFCTQIQKVGKGNGMDWHLEVSLQSTITTSLAGLYDLFESISNAFYEHHLN